MVTNRQVRRLMEMLGKGKNLSAAAATADVDEKTARKYRQLGKLPSELRVEHIWRTREDPFADVWEGYKAKALDQFQFNFKLLNMMASSGQTS